MDSILQTQLILFLIEDKMDNPNPVPVVPDNNTVGVATTDYAQDGVEVEVKKTVGQEVKNGVGYTTTAGVLAAAIFLIVTKFVIKDVVFTEVDTSIIIPAMIVVIDGALIIGKKLLDRI